MELGEGEGRFIFIVFHKETLVAGALSYAELGALISKSGGQFSYYQEAFANLHSFWGALPSFIYSFVTIMYIRPAMVSVIVLTFAEYSIRPFSLWMSMTPKTEYILTTVVSVLALCKDFFQSQSSSVFFSLPIPLI